MQITHNTSCNPITNQIITNNIIFVCHKGIIFCQVFIIEPCVFKMLCLIVTGLCFYVQLTLLVVGNPLSSCWNLKANLEIPGYIYGIGVGVGNGPDVKASDDICRTTTPAGIVIDRVKVLLASFCSTTTFQGSAQAKRS